MSDETKRFETMAAAISTLDEDDGWKQMDPRQLITSSYNYDGTRGLDLYETSKKLSTSDEAGLYTVYEDEFLENDLAQFLVMNLASLLMDFELEGEESKVTAVEDWMYINDTREHLVQVLAQSFMYGTGVAQRWTKGTEFTNFTRLDSATIEIEKLGTDASGRLKRIFTQIQDSDTEEGGSTQKKLNNKRLAVFMPIEVPNRAYGVSMMRSSLLPLQAIRQLNMDIPAGIKRLAYETLVMYLNLEGVPPDQQKTAIRRALKSFAKYDSATNTVVALDSRHKLNYVGTDGGGGKTIAEILPLIEPLLIFLLNKWFVPLGDVLQEKSNRALATTQTATSAKRLKALKAKFARFVERELIAHILGTVDDEGLITRPEVRVVYRAGDEEENAKLDMLIRLWEKDLVTRETVQEKLPFKVLEGDYFSDLNPQVSPDGQEDADEDNVDEELDESDD